jgi:hypothetical protein
MEITEIVGIVSSNPQTRRRRDHSMALLTQKTGARSIVPLDMIWMSAKLVWIKEMPPLASVAQEPRRGEHRRVDPNNEDQMGEINMIFGGSMTIT